MSIRYNKLFALLAEREMKKTDLLEILNSATLAKLAKGEPINTTTIEKICLFLDCQIEDIMEVCKVIEIKNADGSIKKYESRILSKQDIIIKNALEKQEERRFERRIERIQQRNDPEWRWEQKADKHLKKKK